MAVTSFLLSTSTLLLSMLVVSFADEHVTKPSFKKPDLEKYILSSTIAVQGLIYCKSGSIPIEGAVARITCEAVDEHGHETEAVTVLSGASDEKGYFLATLCPSEVKKGKTVRECRAFLEMSPMEDCQVPTNVNGGTSGVPLSSYRVLHDKNMKLYTLLPFFYGSNRDDNSNGY